MKIRIMIIDDNGANLKLAGDLLEIEGFQVSRQLDAESAIKSLEGPLPDMILMDLALPGMDGLQLTRKLKSEPRTKNIRIVALTASAMKGDKERILSAGCDGYIAKPIDTRNFKNTINQFLRHDDE